ncbi:hypothetical protein AMECASPLE_002750 [Ameca splendens]|uniref:Secreted protein n=1 Tax=Ameca splendens TaxID=208324 RepID=A0ABV0Y9S9_9TELE
MESALWTGFYFSMYACAHIHTNIQYGAFRKRSCISQRSEEPPRFVHKHRTLLKELRGTDTTLHINSRLDALTEPVCGSVSEGLSQSHAQFTSVEVSHPVGF